MAGAAWRALASACARGEGSALDAVWYTWLRRPDDEGWELLLRCWDAGRLAEAVFAKATDPDAPPGSRAALGAFCAGHGLAPAEPARRALFYVLTGQSAQHRAADPDGTALAAAYQAAGADVRAALRQAMAGGSDLDLVSVIAARGGGNAHAVPETEAEREYLVAELTRNRDWPRLWRLALDLPLAEAAAAARLFPVGWHPGDESGRQLLGMLAAAEPDEIRQLTRPPVTRINVGNVTTWRGATLGIAPDGSEMAIGTTTVAPIMGSGREARVTDLYALPSGVPSSRRLQTFATSALLHFGDTVVYLDKTRTCAIRRRQELSTRPGQDEPPPSDQTFDGCEIARVPGGFVVAGERKEEMMRNHFVGMGIQLLHGKPVPGVPLRDVTPAGLRAERGIIEQLVSEPGTGRLAVLVARGESSDIVILDPDFSIAARRTGPSYQRLVGFCGPETLVAVELLVQDDQQRPRLISWQVQPPAMSERALVRHDFFFRPVRLLPDRRVLVEERPFGNGHLRCLDADTLRPVPVPDVLSWAQGWSDGFLSSPEGRLAAIRLRWAMDGELVVCDLIRQETGQLLQRPLAQLRHADLAAATSLAARSTDSKVTAALGLVRACLTRRFAADVAIGELPADAVPTGAPDDIALSPES